MLAVVAIAGLEFLAFSAQGGGAVTVDIVFVVGVAAELQAVAAYLSATSLLLRFFGTVGRGDAVRMVFPRIGCYWIGLWGWYIRTQSNQAITKKSVH